MESGRISFGIDEGIAFARSVLEFLTSLFGVVTHTLREIAGDSWLGLTVVFALGFTLLLIRWGAKSSKGVHVYGSSLEYVGRRGLLGCVLALALLAVEYAVAPLLTIFLHALGNTIRGAEPGIAQTVHFLLTTSSGRDDFLSDLATFYSEAHTAFPLGFRTVVILTVSFGSMLLVGKAATSISAPPSAS